MSYWTQYWFQGIACFVSRPRPRSAAWTVLPAARAHLHNNNPDVAHVHHEGVTWGHLLANLGFGLGEEYLAMDEGPVLTEGEGRTLKSS